MADGLIRAEWEKYRPRVLALSELEYNFDAKAYHESKDKSGWNIDHYVGELLREPPGAPLKNGAFEAIKEDMRFYQFPDPRLISAVFDPDRELRGRNMLMRAKFAGFKFYFGVRITDVIDELRTNPSGHPVQAWGYAYRTLKGHFEIGEIRFTVTKNLTTGVVEFEIDAYSKSERIPNLFYRMGFRIFGRSLQKYFARSSFERLRAVGRRALAKLETSNAVVVPPPLGIR